MSTYTNRIIDAELDELFSDLAAISIEGLKGIGKTATALQRAKTIYSLDDSEQAQLIAAQPDLVTRGPSPILIDEWQRVPATWDVVRRAVDRDQSPSQFLLTGSSSPLTPPTHSGAGRIVKLRMRPLSLAERQLETPTVSLGELLKGRIPPVEGSAHFDMVDYTEEIMRSGFPGMRKLTGRALRLQLDSYIDRLVDKDFPEEGHSVRKPGILRSWMAAYAAATSTTATWETIRDAATAGIGDKPSRAVLAPYREILERLWVLDPLPAWLPGRNYFARLALPEKHHLADPSLATRLLGVGRDALLKGEDAPFTVPRDGTLLGHLFESLVTQSVRVYAQQNEARTSHLRTKGGRHEIDIIVERFDRKVIAIEVKLGSTIDLDDVRHLIWLKEKMGDDLLDRIVVTTGKHAYRRTDGIAVVPAALLGP